MPARRGEALKTRIERWLYRTVARLLIPALVLGTIPAPALAGEKESADAEQGPSSNIQAQDQDKGQLDKRRSPNRTLPKVDPLPSRPAFSPDPTDAEIFRARVFTEPLVPVGGASTASQNRDLARALLDYLDAQRPPRPPVRRVAADDISPFTTFLKAHSRSPWRASLLANLGVVYYRTGHFSKALQAWEESWNLARQDETPYGRAVADRAIGELAVMNARLGRMDRLEAIFAEIEGRNVRGPGKINLDAARQGHWMMEHKPEKAFKCGPYALARIQAFRGTSELDPRIASFPSTQQGTSLAQIAGLANELGMGYRMAKRKPGAKLVLPSVVHWKVGHFGALLRKEGERYLVEDPTFQEDIWVTEAALESETTGYFLVPDGKLPAGWQSVDAAEGKSVWGKGHIQGKDPGGTGPPDPQTPPPPPCNGLAQYTIHLMLVSLHIFDTPLAYTPPRGPSVRFTATYNQKEAYQPAIFSYSNFGAQWTFDWLSYVVDDPTNAAAALQLYTRGGGTLFFSAPVGGVTPPDVKTQTTLTRTTADVFDPSYPPTDPAYVRLFPNGSQEIYYESDHAATAPRKVLLKEIVDPAGNRLKVSYDADLRLVAVSDAIGQVSTLSYDLPLDPYKITSVTDPFGRTARFDYDATGRLVKITDVIGLTSEFTYGSGDFITTLTTPYGTARFAEGIVSGNDPWVEATDPLGGKERVEFAFHLHQNPALVAALDPPDSLPNGVPSPPIEVFAGSNTFHWDKRAMALYPGDYTKAVNYRWARGPFSGNSIATTIPWGIKRPLENRVYYFYAGQPDVFSTGTIGRPSQVTRVLGLDGQGNKIEQSRFYEYNAIGKVIKATDPVGRETVYVYGNNNTPDPVPATGSGLDLLQVKQKNPAGPGGYDLLRSYTYNAQHLPLTDLSASGWTRIHTYNGQGQILQSATPWSAVIASYGYDSNGYLTSVTPDPGAASRPAANSATTMTYDGYGRLRTITDSEGYAVTLDYDGLDRPTRVTFPDGTYEQTVYNRLDPERRRDRLGRWSETFYDAQRRVTSTRDPLGRVVTQEWCTCGSLDRLVDANGNATSWDRDVQGRAIREARADGSATRFAYETTTSRLQQVTDRKGQVKSYAYRIDDNLQQITYTNAQFPTPNVSFSYDANYDRRLTMVDGTGTTTYAYHPVTSPPAAGAKRLASVDGPLPNDTMTYTYDFSLQAEHVVQRRDSDNVGFSRSFDSLGRMTLENNLASFTYSHVGATSRLSNVTSGNGQATSYAYLGHTGDERLQEIHNKYPGGATLSKFGYTYDAVGNIKTWTQQADSNPATVYDFAYDAADQLAAATLKTTGVPPTILKRYGYAYDKAGNRTTEQIDDTPLAATYNSLNELTSQQPGGALLFRGSINEAGTVTVQGKPAVVTPSNAFEGPAQVPGGTSNVQVQATDSSGNVRTNTYQVTVAGANKTFSYDLNGNTTSDGTRTFEWDAENRLLAVNQGTHRSEFAYDGEGKRVKIVEKDNGLVTSDKRYVWCDWDLCLEKDSSGSTTKRIFDQLEGVTGPSSYYARDHLGSIRELVDTAGSAVQARYEYDPYGRRTKISGALDAMFGYTGQQYDPVTEFHYYKARYYDSRIGRFFSEDPIRFGGGMNFYAYVLNNPINHVDPLGLKCGSECSADFVACKSRVFWVFLTLEAVCDIICDAATGGTTIAQCFVACLSAFKSTEVLAVQACEESFKRCLEGACPC